MTRKLISFKDVALAYFRGGVEAIEAMSPAPSADTMLRTIQFVQQGGNDTHELEDFYGRTYTEGTRGRSAPEPGEDRTYKVQQHGDEIPWIRVPLHTLGDVTPEEVRASFAEGSVLIQSN
jgi:hypothetical protein